MKTFLSFGLIFIFCAAADGGQFRCFSSAGTEPIIVNTPTDGGIREEIGGKYKPRFTKWKQELLSTEFGRAQWELYANNKNFILTIKMSDERGQGAGTDKYLWDETGKFVGATITLGTKLDKGYPDPIYYPVMNSLAPTGDKYSTGGELLAATKIVHEIGHVNQTAAANRETILTQNRLMPEYVSIFLKNGRNTRDEKLIELAARMGGTPVEIWENREYWSEVNALSFLKERIGGEIYYCDVFSKIQSNIEQYAKNYEERFEKVAELPATACKK